MRMIPEAMTSEREIRTELLLRGRDMDHLGHLNHAKYPEFFEEPRVALVRPLFSERGYWVLRRLELDYLSEVRLDHGTVVVTARVSGLSRRSITLDQELVLPDGTVAATAVAVMVAWDTETRGARVLSEEERAVLLGMAAQ